MFSNFWHSTGIWCFSKQMCVCVCVVNTSHLLCHWNILQIFQCSNSLLKQNSCQWLNLSIESHCRKISVFALHFCCRKKILEQWHMEQQTDHFLQNSTIFPMRVLPLLDGSWTIWKLQKQKWLILFERWVRVCNAHLLHLIICSSVVCCPCAVIAFWLFGFLSNKSKQSHCQNNWSLRTQLLEMSPQNNSVTNRDSSVVRLADIVMPNWNHRNLIPPLGRPFDCPLLSPFTGPLCLTLDKLLLLQQTAGLSNTLTWVPELRPLVWSSFWKTNHANWKNQRCKIWAIFSWHEQWTCIGDKHWS